MSSLANVLPQKLVLRRRGMATGSIDSISSEKGFTPGNGKQGVPVKKEVCYGRKTSKSEAHN